MGFQDLLQEHVPLNNYSTLCIGGPARYFVAAADDETVRSATRWAIDRDLPLFVLGGGSNIVIADGGFPGLVLYMTSRGITSRVDNGQVFVEAAAGEDWDSFVAHTVNNNWSGLECLSGIPGKIGATPIQNVGAYGQEVKETITHVRVYDRECDEIVTLTNDECQFSYRNSLFKSTAAGRYIVLGVGYRLQKDGQPAVRYPELQKYLSDQHKNEPTLNETRDAVITIRSKKAMVLDETDADARSVGSFFVNPVINTEQFEMLSESLRISGVVGADEKIPSFPAADGSVKLSAAWLIERAGFRKGYLHGNVGLSTKHALAITNRGQGTAREIVELAEKIKFVVREKFGITLTPEPVFIGF